MTTQYKTQCPRCHTIYPMPAAQLNKPKARANCGKCHHTFFLNLHLIDDKQKATENTIKQQPSSVDVNQTNPNKQTQANQAQKQQAQKQQAQALIDDTSNISVPRIPTRQKKSKPIATEGMIYDDMDSGSSDTGEVYFDDDELNAFLNQSIQNTPVAAATKNNGQDNNSDEAWLDDLLKDNSPAVEVNPVAKQAADDEDISKLIGADLDSLIPEVMNHEDPETIRQKVNARLSEHAPTQEQLATKRSLSSQLLWLAGCVLMIAALAVQYVVFNQDAIAKNPTQAELVQHWCSICKLPAADTQAFKINHQLKNGSADYSTDLSGTLKNTSDAEQLYPNLRIQVMGNAGLVGDLVLSPSDYLAVYHRSLIPGQETRFLLTLDVAIKDVKSVTIEPFY